MASSSDKPSKRDELPAGVTSIVPPLVLAGVAAALLYAAYGYGATARQLPAVVGWSTLLLLLLDLVARIPGPVGNAVHRSLGAGFSDHEMTATPRWQDEFRLAAWVAACVGCIVLVGFVVTIPVFIAAYLILQAKRSLLSSLAIAAVVTAVIVFLFENLLEYELFEGMLLNSDRFG